ncbi:MAG: hypothetical protein IJ757_06950 [Clostridiales bacterium]|nr:hypothetical protein [Clostridiales bacterium]
MITLPMALMDLVPVMLFIIAAVILQRGLYDCMSKGSFALFSGGTVMICAAGLFKFTWKLLMALDICDFERLNQCFFPMQSVGFLLAGIASVAFVFFPQKNEHKFDRAAGAMLIAGKYSGTMIFVSAMILGTLGLCLGLAVESKRRNRILPMIMFILSFVFMLMMGYLSSKDFDKASMNWIAQGVNVIGQSIFLIGAVSLTKRS